MYATLKDVLSGYALSARFQSMKLEHVEYDLSCMTVLFIAMTDKTDLCVR